MEEKLWRKAGLLMFDSGTQPSSARASHLALINHFSSLLRGVSSVVATIAEEPLMCFWMDGTKPAAPFPSLPLGWVPAIQWELVKFNLKITNMNKNTFLLVKGTVVYAQLRLFPFNLIRKWWLRNQLDLVLLQILQNGFPIGGLFLNNLQSQQHTQSITNRLRDSILCPGKRGCKCLF